MNEASVPFDPDWTVAPGDILRRELEARGVSVKQLCDEIQRIKGITHSWAWQYVEEVLDGSAPIYDAFAADLEAVLTVSAEFWMRLESRYRLDLTRGRKRLSADGPLETVETRD